MGSSSNPAPSPQTAHVSAPSPRAVADAMFSRDHAAIAAGMEVTHVAHGCATVTMIVRNDMVNGHNICHGGYMALLCDTAFAYACNSYNFNTVASGFSIEILAPAKLGDVLSATGVEQVQRGRSGVYDIKLGNQNGEIIALFRGKSARIAGQVLEDSA